MTIGGIILAGLGVAAATTLLGIVKDTVSTHVSNHVMVNQLWELVGIVPTLLYDASLIGSTLLLHESLFVEFNFFPKLSNWRDILTWAFTENTLMKGMQQMISPLMTALDVFAWGIFAVCMYIIVFNLLFAAPGSNKALNPIKSVVRIIAFAFLLFTWKQIMGIYLRAFQTIVNALGSGTYAIFKDLSEIDPISAPSDIKLKYGILGLFVNISESLSNAFSQENVLYVFHALLICGIAIAMIQAAFSYAERYISFAFYSFVGAPFIAMGLYEGSADTFKDWIKGILSQSIGIMFALSGLYMAFSCMLAEPLTDSSPNYMSLILCIVFFNFSKNSEKFLNMVGFKTMPSQDTFRSLMAGAGALTAGVSATKPFVMQNARMAGQLASAPFAVAQDTVRQVGNTILRNQTSQYLQERANNVELKNDASSVNTLSQQGSQATNIASMSTALTQASNAERAAQANYANVSKDAKQEQSQSIRAAQNKYDQKIASANANYDQAINNINNKFDAAAQELGEKYGYSGKEYRAGMEEIKQGRQSEINGANAIKNNEINDARGEFNRAKEAANDKFNEKVQSARSEFERASADKATAATNLKNAQDAFQESMRSNPIKSSDLVDKGTGKNVEILTDRDGNAYAKAQVSSSDRLGGQSVRDVIVPLNDSPALQEGKNLYNMDGEAVGRSSGQLSENSNISSFRNSEQVVKYEDINDVFNDIESTSTDDYLYDDLDDMLKEDPKVLDETFDDFDTSVIDNNDEE